MLFTLTQFPDYIIEKEPLVNKFISVPKDKGEFIQGYFLLWGVSS